MYKHDKEAENIYCSIFSNKIPEVIKLRFNEFSQTINNNYHDAEVRKYNELILKVNDLEALELAARYCRKLPILTEKFKIMIYMSETIPGNYDLFINENPKNLSGYVAISASIIRTIFKMAKGLIILLTYRI